MARTGEPLRRDGKALGRLRHRGHRLVGVDAQVELLDHAAQVGHIFLAGDALLVVVLDRHAGNRQPFGGAEKAGVARPPGHGVGDLVRVEVDIVDAGAAQAGRQFDPDGTGADDRHVIADAAPCRRSDSKVGSSYSPMMDEFCRLQNIMAHAVLSVPSTTIRRIASAALR